MVQTEISYLPSGEAIAFLGIAAQAAAVVWVWRDWKMSQFQHGDWRKAHSQSESETLKRIDGLWMKFGGPASAGAIDWDNIGSSEIEDISKVFPAEGDEEALKKRKIDVLTPRHGIGPSDADYVKIRSHLEHLALLRRGIADYRNFIRRKTFQTALRLILIGFALQLVGSLPSRWLIAVDSTPTATNQEK